MLLTLTLFTTLFLVLYLTEKRRFLNAVALGLIGIYMIRAFIMHYPLLLSNDQGLFQKWGYLLYWEAFQALCLFYQSQCFSIVKYY